MPLPRAVSLPLAALVVMGVVLSAGPAAAHKLKIFATAVGAQIEGQVYFVGSGAAPGARVNVETVEGTPISTVTCDKDGHFTVIAAERIDHVLRADTGDGHAASITIAASQLPETLPESLAGSAPMGGTAAVSAAKAAIPSGAVAAVSPPAAAQANALANQERAEQVRTVVAQELEPLREQLNAYEDQTRFRDILGGFGYILGLAGLGLWLRARALLKRLQHEPESLPTGQTFQTNQSIQTGAHRS